MNDTEFAELVRSIVESFGECEAVGCRNPAVRRVPWDSGIVGGPMYANLCDLCDARSWRTSFPGLKREARSAAPKEGVFRWEAFV